jgi:hypothetical protein
MTKKPLKPSLKIVTSSTPTGPQPPRKLGRHGMDLWCTVTSEYNISDAGGIEILALACQALDRAEEMAAAIDKDGTTIMMKSGLREHPLLKSELANRAFIARNLQRLGLNIETVKPIGRPPGIRS